MEQVIVHREKESHRKSKIVHFVSLKYWFFKFFKFKKAIYSNHPFSVLPIHHPFYDFLDHFQKSCLFKTFQIPLLYLSFLHLIADQMPILSFYPLLIVIFLALLDKWSYWHEYFMPDMIQAKIVFLLDQGQFLKQSLNQLLMILSNSLNYILSNQGFYFLNSYRLINETDLKIFSKVHSNFKVAIQKQDS